MPEYMNVLVTPLAQLWGISAPAMVGLFSIFILLAVVGVIVFKTKSKDMGAVVFIVGLFLECMLGWVNWVVFVLVIVISAGVYLRFGHGGSG